MSMEGAKENYAGTFEGRIGFGVRPALILIDFVQAYFEKSSPLYADVDDTLKSALQLRRAAREAGVPVFYTNVEFDQSMKNGEFSRKIKSLEVFSGNPLGGWPEGMVQEDEIVLTKQYASAFFGTSLSSTLTSMGCDSLIITGLSTSGCVRATCVDAVSMNFMPIVVEEAVGDRHEDVHQANLFDMNAKYGDVVTLQEVLSSLIK